MEKQILSFSDHFSKFLSLDVEIRKWIVQSIAGALTADHPLTENKYHFVKSVLAEEDIIWQEMEVHLEKNESISAPPIDIPIELAETIFNYIIKVCLSNRKLSSKEMHYINKVGTELNIETGKKQKIFKQIIFQTKDEFIRKLIRNLNQKERYWLAVMTLKMIYADGEVHPKELSHLSYIANLLTDNSETLKSVKEDAASKPLSEFEKIHFDKTIVDSIMEYLLGIIMSDQDFSEKELSLIYEIAQTIEYSKIRLKELIESVKLDYQSLFL